MEFLFRNHHSLFLSFPGGLVVKICPASAGDTRDLGLISGSGRSTGGGYGNLLQYSWLENPMDWGTWWATGLQRVGHNWSDLAHMHIQASLKLEKALTPPYSIFLSGRMLGCLPWMQKACTYPVLGWKKKHWVIDRDSSGLVDLSHLKKGPRATAHMQARRRVGGVQGDGRQTVIEGIDITLRLSWWLRSKESACKAEAAGDAGSSPGWRPTPVYLPGESHGQRRLVGNSPYCHQELDKTKAT